MMYFVLSKGNIFEKKYTCVWGNQGRFLRFLYGDSDPSIALSYKKVGTPVSYEKALQIIREDENRYPELPHTLMPHTPEARMI